MHFVLLVEGRTELVLPAFLKRWLDSRLPERVGIRVIPFQGWGELFRDVASTAKIELRRNDVIAVISLLDLFGPTIYPASRIDAKSRYVWAKSHIENKVKHPRFHQFFAIHETEAWLLSDPSIFPVGVRQKIERVADSPETVNDDTPPSQLLNQLYQAHANRKYRKVAESRVLFPALNPEIAYQKCASLRALLDKMLELAQNAMNQGT